MSDCSFHIAVMDFGIKRSILEKLREACCHVTLIPGKATFDEVMQLNADGVVLSNGPGDPSYSNVETIARLIEMGVPLFGICLGHQLLALASGAKIVKMKVGHHSVNHPILDVATKRVLISAQNHCFVVDEKQLPSSLKVTHRSLVDGSIAGLCRIDRPAFSFQGHPEASAGPHDFHYLFDHFVSLCQTVRI